jgi:hypothetical protein
MSIATLWEGWGHQPSPDGMVECMKRLIYVTQANGLSPVVVSAFLLGCVAILLGSDPAMTTKTIVNFLLITSAFLSVIIITYIFKPEDTPALELHAALPFPLWRSVAEKVALNWLIINIIGDLTILLLIMVKGGDGPTFARGMVAMMANTFFVGGITLCGTTWGRNSKGGLLVGLLVFLLLFLNPFRDSLAFLEPFNIFGTSLKWWVGRLVYGILGIGITIISFRLTQNINYLFTGDQNKNVSMPQKLNLLGMRTSFLSLTTVPIPLKLGGSVAYEALLVFRDGIIPLFMFIVCFLFGIIFSVVSFVNCGFDIPTLLDGFTTYLQTLPYFAFPVLIFFGASLVSQDRENKVDEFVLTASPSRNYLAHKILGTYLAITFAICASDVLPVTGLLMAAVGGSPMYLIAHIGFLLSTLSIVFYWTAMSILLGALVKHNSLILRGLMSLGYVILFVITFNSVVGNVLFPSGMMAMETIGAWLRQYTGQIYSSIVPINTIVPFYYLLFPLVSAGIQVATIWAVVCKNFEERYHHD